jgi:hypothetical protein
MSNELALWTEAKRAVAACRSIDEVKKILDKSEAMRHYAAMAKDVKLLQDAAEIKDRAQRRLNQMLADQPKHKGGQPQKNQVTPKPSSFPLTLKERGIDKNLAHRLRKRERADLSIPEEDYEREVIPKVRARVAKSAETVKPTTKTYVASKRTINLHQFAAATCRKLLNEVKTLTNSKDFKMLIKLRMELEEDDKTEIEERIGETIIVLKTLINELCQRKDPKVIDIKTRREL